MSSRAMLALASHRPETIAPALKLMAQHKVVILEDPPDSRFQSMLSGRLPIPSYLETLDLEYPEFSRRMAAGLRGLHDAGVELVQIEPFIENLITIHELFAGGAGPQDLQADGELRKVYRAERKATAALIDFYGTSMQGSFAETVEAVKRFARADAKRFVLRDQMRAEAIAAVLKRPGSYYIESGQIHYLLWRELKRRLPARCHLSVKFVMAEAVREMGYRGHLYGPGDLLTLLYQFHPNRRLRVENLYAGRALIYNKLIAKEEIVQSAEEFPHTRNELQTAAIVRQLSLEDCRHLYSLVRRASTDTARDIIRHYMKQTRRQSSDDCDPCA